MSSRPGEHNIPLANIPRLPNSQQQGFPVNSFPPVLRNTITALHEDTGIPPELIGNVVLAAASLACQSHIHVIPPYSDTAEQCSLYLLTIAESGEGKTTINKQVMKPFYEFSARMKREFETQLVAYKRDHNIWKIKQQALNSNLRQAIKKNYSGENEAKAIEEHAETEPERPLRPDFIYEDVSLKALVEGLGECPEAGFITDEAITFFKSYLKNNPGLLNKAWDGEAFDFRRADGEIYNIVPCLTFSLMAQPGVFMAYIRKYSDVARNSGFLSRFLFSWVNSTLGNRGENTSHDLTNASLAHLHTRINELLEMQRARFNHKDIVKKRLPLNEEAKAFWRKQWSETERRMATGNEWEHIRDIAAKSGANTLRIAAILTFFNNSDAETIDKKTMEQAFTIMDWYIRQASQLFYPMSERYQFEQDVRELHQWLKHRFDQYNGCAFPKNEVEKYGPSRLRRTEKLNPVLNQLIGQRMLTIIKMQPHGALYLSYLTTDGYYVVPENIQPCSPVIMVQSADNTQNPAFIVDLY
ncbi:TPA: YfjI family protein [Klebsiella aerogenes]|uniref:YfjI family protein n=1 Tax=Klebsiella TaxID=570 RepID=UPI000B28B538|nr:MULTISPECIES: YfjI family protein [Klebsiella]ELA1689125.1 DUF3987 domain-containing protein [Klebsiella aerogenes]ELW9546147.1 DUF3987 domain-containing protein [Klebsiella aerogenes]MDU9142589.1 YfjI family protein [Klebsiella aerogenes]MDU9356772.1 YfjI family protein [Klebsiella sp. 141153]HBR6853196.1 DUF3987 domain-containing protein [Klebsiella aerogenes]